MQSTNIGYHSDSLLLKIYEKNFLLPFASLLVESVRNSPTRFIDFTDYRRERPDHHRSHSPAISRIGASNEKGEVEIKGLHIPARQQLVFQCLGYEMKALPFQEVKQHPNVRLKEKITELPEAVVLAQPLPRLLALTHKQLYKKYPAKKEYVRYYAPASYYKSVECKGHCVNLRHEYGLFI